MLKRILAAMLAAAMALSLVACSSSTDSSDSSDSSSDSSSSSSDSSSEDSSSEESTSTLTNDGSNHVEAICWDPAFNIYALEVATEYYLVENPDFTINIVETAWDDVQTRIITTATSGTYEDMADIFLCQNNAFQKNTYNYPDMFLELTDFEEIPWDDYGEGVLNYSTLNGVNYGIPFDNGTAVLALREDYLAEAGYTIEDFTDISWETFIEQGEVVLAETGHALLSQTSDAGDLLIMMLKTSGTSLFDESGEPYLAENAALADALALYAEMVEKGIAVLYSSGDETNAAYVNGTVAGVINGCWILGTVQTATDQSGLWGVTSVPYMSTVEGSIPYSENGGSSWAISGGSANQEIALDFLVSTFCESVDFYDEILASAAAIANWAPAGESDVYLEEQEFFDGQAIYSDIVEYGTHVLAFNTGVYYYEAQDAVAVALSDVMGGISIEDALATAQSTVEFAMS